MHSDIVMLNFMLDGLETAISIMQDAQIVVAVAQVTPATFGTLGSTCTCT